MDNLDSRATILGGQIEVQFVGDITPRLFLTEKHVDVGQVPHQVNMSMRTAYDLLAWLSDHRDAIRQAAEEEEAEWL